MWSNSFHSMKWSVNASNFLVICLHMRYWLFEKLYQFLHRAKSIIRKSTYWDWSSHITIKTFTKWVLLKITIWNDLLNVMLTFDIFGYLHQITINCPSLFHLRLEIYQICHGYLSVSIFWITILHINLTSSYDYCACGFEMFYVICSHLTQ